MSEVKSHVWIGIAWYPLPSRKSICKKLIANKAITEANALNRFKTKFPKMRNYTIQKG